MDKDYFRGLVSVLIILVIIFLFINYYISYTFGAEHIEFLKQQIEMLNRPEYYYESF